MEMPSGGIGRGPVLLMIGALPVVTTGEHLFQTSAGQAVDSQLRDGNENNLEKFTAVNLSVWELHFPIGFLFSQGKMN